MAQIYLKVLLIMAVLVAFAVPGFLLKKLKLAGEGAEYTLSNILLYVCQPALAVSAFCVFDGAERERVYSIPVLELLKNFALSAAIAVIAILIALVLGKLVFIKLRERKSADVYAFCGAFSNCGFFGVPFAEMFTGGDPLAVIYVMVFNLVFTVLVWTAGVALITGGVSEIRLKKLVCNPAIISGAVALVLFFVPQINIFSFEGLEELQIFPEYLSHMTAPLSMVIVGMRLADADLKAMFCNAGVYLCSALRLVVAPVLTFGIVAAFFYMCGGATADTEYVFFAPVLCMTMSPAASVVAMAERFGGDKQSATSAFVAGTLLSVVTIPLVITAAMAVWGVMFTP